MSRTEWCSNTLSRRWCTVEGYELIASARCSDRTIRRRLTEWAEQGIGQKLHQLALAAYDKIVGLELDDLATDGCITKAPCGGDKAGPSPVDRRKGGLKRSTTTEARGVPVGMVSAGANRHDSPLLEPTIDNMKQQVGALPEKPTMHLDSGYDGQPSRDVLAAHEMVGEIAKKGIPMGQRSTAHTNGTDRAGADNASQAAGGAAPRGRGRRTRRSNDP